MWKTNTSINYSKQKKKEKKKVCIILQEKIICTTKRNNLKHNDDLKKQIKSHGKVCKSKYFCGIEMPSEKDNIL